MTRQRVAKCLLTTKGGTARHNVTPQGDLDGCTRLADAGGVREESAPVQVGYGRLAQGIVSLGVRDNKAGPASR